MIHDPRILKYFFLVGSYLIAGMVTWNKITGHPPIDNESTLFVVVFNAILIPLAVIGPVRTKRCRTFLLFDRRVWIICPGVCYFIGVIISLVKQ